MPAQGGSAPGTGADGVNVFPQLSVSGGAVGAVAKAGHATVEEPPGGIVTDGVVIVYV